jgi:hypothetical protein
MSIPTLEKQPGESKIFSMNFTARIASSATIASITSITATPAGLTLVGSATAVGKKVFQRISGGTNLASHLITIVIVDSDGNTVEGEGRLNVFDRA